MNKKKKAMLNRKFKNIIEFKEKKQQKMIEFLINDLFFNVLFERFKTFSDFD